MKYYYVDSSLGWLICYTANKKNAIKCGKSEFGYTDEARLATNKEIEYYCKVKGIDELKQYEVVGKDEHDRSIWGLIPKEPNRIRQLIFYPE